MSKTREKFQQRKKERQAARAHDAYLAAHTLFCQGKRRRHGKENQPCEWPIQFGKLYDGANALCRRCGQLHRSYSDKWYRAQDYELEVYKREKEEANAHESEVGYNPYYAPWETAIHDPECDHKGVDLLGLRRTQRTMLAGPGVTRMATAMVDRENKVQHWCRPASGKA